MIVKNSQALNDCTASESCIFLDRDSYQYVLEGFRTLLSVSPLIERHLAGVLTETLQHAGSLVRAQLSFALMTSHDVPREEARKLAIAVEYLHTASLLLDDLPNMDDATERRGHVCPHIKYGEAATTLGALGFVNEGYALLWQVIGSLDATSSQRAAELVSSCLGTDGILNGQSLDLHFAETRGRESDILNIAYGKTVSLIRLSLVLPGIVAGVDDQTLDRLEDLSVAWGLSYQILDDFKDCLMTETESGKTAARDAAQQHPNLVVATGTRYALEKLLSLLGHAEKTIQALARKHRAWIALSRLQARFEAQSQELQKRIRIAACA